MSDKQHKKEYTLAELTENLEVEIQGDPQCVIKGICTINHAQPGYITFLMNPLYKKYLQVTQAVAVILSKEDAESCSVNAVITRNPYYVYAKIAAFFDQKPLPKSGIHPTAVIGEDCDIDTSVSIGPHCVIGNGVKIGANVVMGPGCVIGESTEIGEDTWLDANVTLYHQIVIGKRVRIASGCVIGSDGFGLAKHKGEWHKVPQLGRVVIGDDADIGSNCSIDRGAIDDTVIEKGVKLDNLIQVGHNARIGENTAIAGCVGIAGSAVIGKNCLIGGGTGINGHITVADNVVVTGMTAVTKSIRDPGVYSSGIGGLVTNLEWRKNTARVHRLEHLIQQVKNLESIIDELTAEGKAT
jgi:UDP-3-O-[3-hydroxymyristoyl] glucosamine N-acyltransferase